MIPKPTIAHNCMKIYYTFFQVVHSRCVCQIIQYVFIVSTTLYINIISSTFIQYYILTTCFGPCIWPSSGFSTNFFEAISISSIMWGEQDLTSQTMGGMVCCLVSRVIFLFLVCCCMHVVNI